MRDVFLYAVAIGVALRWRGPLKLPALAGWVLAWIAVVLIQLANPGDHGITHSVAALRQHLEFVPLFFLGYALLRSYASLHAFFALLLAVAAINGAVAAYQTTLSPGQLGGWGPGYDALVSGPSPSLFTGANGQAKVRPPGLGADEGFSGILGACALPGGVALLMAYRRRRWLSALIVLGIIGAAVGVLELGIALLADHGGRRPGGDAGADGRRATGQAGAARALPGGGVGGRRRDRDRQLQQHRFLSLLVDRAEQGGLDDLQLAFGDLVTDVRLRAPDPVRRRAGKRRPGGRQGGRRRDQVRRRESVLVPGRRARHSGAGGCSSPSRLRCASTVVKGSDASATATRSS